MRIVICALVGLLVSGCEYNEGGGAGFFVRCRTVKGHEYITYGNGHGCSIIHSESCPCKTNKVEVNK